MHDFWQIASSVLGWGKSVPPPMSSYDRKIDQWNLPAFSSRTNLSVCKGARTQSHLVCKWTLNHMIKPVWPNGWVFVCKLSGFGFEFYCSHLNLRYGACLKQRVSWHLGNQCGFTLNLYVTSKDKVR